MVPPIPNALKRVSFTLVLAISITNIILGFASKNKESALHNISQGSLPLITDILLAVWVLFSVIYTGITYHYTRSKPFWTAANLATVLLMTAFFTSYLKFDPFDWPIWGPFATVLGVVARAGLEVIYNSADRDMARGFWSSLWGGNGSGGDNGDNLDGGNGGRNSHAMTTLQRSRSAE